MPSAPHADRITVEPRRAHEMKAQFAAPGPQSSQVGRLPLHRYIDTIATQVHTVFAAKYRQWLAALCIQHFHLDPAAPGLYIADIDLEPQFLSAQFHRARGQKTGGFSIRGFHADIIIAPQGGQAHARKVHPASADVGIVIHFVLPGPGSPLLAVAAVVEVNGIV